MSRMQGPLSALRQLPRRVAADGAVVLAYHDVVADDAVATGLTVERHRFERHLDVLTALGLEVVSLSRLVDALVGGERMKGLAAITFDDALLGVHDQAMPALTDRAMTATVFTVTGHLGVRPPWWPAMQRTVDPDELASLHAAGLELASHTVNHASLPSLSPAQVEYELATSRQELELLSGARVDLLAYPSGHHSPSVRVQVAEAGYRAAFTFLNGRITGGEDRLVLPRLTMGAHVTSTRLRYHLLRSAPSWPDHQADSVGPDRGVDSQ